MVVVTAKPITETRMYLLIQVFRRRRFFHPILFSTLSSHFIMNNFLMVGMSSGLIGGICRLVHSSINFNMKYPQPELAMHKRKDCYIKAGENNNVV